MLTSCGLNFKPLFHIDMKKKINNFETQQQMCRFIGNNYHLGLIGFCVVPHDRTTNYGHVKNAIGLQKRLSTETAGRITDDDFRFAATRHTNIFVECRVFLNFCPKKKPKKWGNDFADLVHQYCRTLYTGTRFTDVTRRRVMYINGVRFRTRL